MKELNEDHHEHSTDGSILILFPLIILFWIAIACLVIRCSENWKAWEGTAEGTFALSWILILLISYSIEALSEISTLIIGCCAGCMSFWLHNKMSGKELILYICCLVTLRVLWSFVHRSRKKSNIE